MSLTDRPQVLVVDDEPSSRRNIRDVLLPEQYGVDEAEHGAAAVSMLSEKTYDVVLLDMRMPVMDGFAALKKMRGQHPDLPIIIFTAFGTSDRAIEAMKIGAFDYLTKPFDIEELLTSVRRAVEYKSMVQEVRQLRSRLAEVEAGEYRPDKFISSSPIMQNMFKLIGKVASSDSTVLIEGETGTGKELVANAIWYHSERRHKPFVKVNCAAIAESLLESELFGHEKGAFTDAHAQRKGHFESANGGTLFLDEIGEMSSSLQSKLLRILEQHEFLRVGGHSTIKVDVRILAATNRSLQAEMEEGRFRKDLFFRLHVVHLVVPPLRVRKEDIAPLVSHFLGKYSGRRSLIVSKEAMDALLWYPWPGNVRELENVIERATIITQGNVISAEHLSFGGRTMPMKNDSRQKRIHNPTHHSLRDTLAAVEKETILNALHHAEWNRSEAARLLGIDRRQLFNKIKTYGLKPESTEASGGKRQPKGKKRPT